MDTPTIIATGFGAAGFVVALIALGLQLKRRSDEKARTEKRIQAAEQLRKGQTLARKLNELDRASGPWEEIEREIVAWHNETEALLTPEFRSQFESSAGMTFYTSQYTEYSRLNNHLIGRLARLGEIIGADLRARASFARRRARRLRSSCRSVASAVVRASASSSTCR